MPLLLLAAFIGIPLIEIAVFIQVGGFIGLWPTIGTVILTAVIGVGLLRAQGLATMTRAQASVERGEMPMREVFDGACLLVAGALLLTPGFVTDTLGFILLVPAFRSALLKVGGNWVKRHGTVHTHHAHHAGGHGRHRHESKTVIIEAEYEDVTGRDDADADDTDDTGGDKPKLGH